MALAFYNTLTRTTAAFVPREPGVARLYTCGPTVYNFAHLGNYRTYVFEDLLRRILQGCGYRVIQVMNLTDVDDKTIRGASAAGVPLNEFTAPYKQAFFADLKELRIQPAEHYPAATDHIPEMIALIAKLFERGYAYRSDDGSVYFAIDRWADYGKLARIDRRGQQAGARVRTDEYEKEAVADFALWKAWDAADGAVGWESPWGRGRPGWHIECSAMSMKYLGPHFDLHTGGIDNMFPHHEDEIAQSEAANGCPFVNYWLHSEHLLVDGQKMAKSLGNFHTLRDVLAKGYTGREVRWLLLGAHYRAKLSFSFAGLDQARAALRRLDEFIRRLREAAATPDRGLAEAESLAAAAETAFRQGVEDDLNVPAALAAVFDLAREGNRLLDGATLGGAGAERLLTACRRWDEVLGVLDVAAVAEVVPAAIHALVAERQRARQARDFARADAIRQELTAAGWRLEDTPAGPRVVRLTARP